MQFLWPRRVPPRPRGTSCVIAQRVSADGVSTAHHRAATRQPADHLRLVGVAGAAEENSDDFQPNLAHPRFLQCSSISSSQDRNRWSGQTCPSASRFIRDYRTRSCARQHIIACHPRTHLDLGPSGQAVAASPTCGQPSNEMTRTSRWSPRLARTCRTAPLVPAGWHPRHNQTRSGRSLTSSLCEPMTAVNLPVW
jgi:hypothetical protein